jgi:1-acyl-sn-glycerol-3-phosphate acyltransferase
MKEKGYSFLIFPEGTRSRNGKIKEFRRGGFFLALTSQSAIVPISIQGTYELMPKGSFFVKRGKIKISFYPPVSVQGKQKDDLPLLLEKVRGVIRSGLAESENDARRMG